MAINLSLAGDYYEIPDGSYQDLPTTGWVIGCWHRLTTATTGANLRTLWSNGSSGSQRSVAGIAGPGGTVPNAFQATAEYASGATTARGDQGRGADSEWRLVLQMYSPSRTRDGQLIYAGKRNGAIRREGSASVTSPTLISPASTFRWGAPAGVPTSSNNFIGDLHQGFIFKGELTDLEMCLLLQGKDIITDLGKSTASCAVFDFTSAAATILDRSGTLTATRNGTGITTTIAPVFAVSGTVAFVDGYSGEVIQYDEGATTAAITTVVCYTGSPALIEYQIVNASDGTTVINDWTTVQASPAAAPTGTAVLMTLPSAPRGDIAAGKAWYNFKIRATGATEVIDVTTKPSVGVGAVGQFNGQSNNARKFSQNSGSNPTPTTYVTVAGAVPAHDASIAMANGWAASANWPCMFVNTSVGGTFLLTALSGASAGSTDWQSSVSGGLQDISNKKMQYLARGKYSFIVWDQGEADGTSVGFVAADYSAALQALAANYRTQTGRTVNGLKFLVTGTGAASSSTAGIDTPLSAIRAVQQQVGTTIAGFGFIGSMLHLALNDTIHCSDAQQKLRGAMTIDAVLKSLGIISGGSVGPVITSWRYAGQVATVTVQNSGGSALTMRSPGTSIPRGFVFTDTTGVIPVTGFSITGAGELRFTWGRNSTGAVTLDYNRNRMGAVPQSLSTTVAPIHTTNAATTVVIDAPSHGLKVTDLVNIVSIAASGNSVPATVAGQYVGDLQTVSAIPSANAITITLTTTASSALDGGLTPPLGLRYLNDVVDNSTPGGLSVGRPLNPISIVGVGAAGSIVYETWTQFVPKGTAAQIATAGLS